MALGLSDLIAPRGLLARARTIRAASAILETLAEAGQLAAGPGITLAFETGQETADLLRLTLDELRLPNLKVNFDPANMLLYDMGDPIRAVEILGPDIRSVHVKDARRPTVRRRSGDEEVPLGQGEVNIREFVKALKKNGYTGPAHHRARSRRSGRPAARRRALGLRSCLRRVARRAVTRRSGLRRIRSRDNETSCGTRASSRGRSRIRERSIPKPGCRARERPSRRRQRTPSRRQFTTELTTCASWRPASVRA